MEVTTDKETVHIDKHTRRETNTHVKKLVCRVKPRNPSSYGVAAVVSRVLEVLELLLLTTQGSFTQRNASCRPFMLHTQKKTIIYVEVRMS